MSVPTVASDSRVAIVCGVIKGTPRCADADSAEGMKIKQAEVDRTRELDWARRGLMKKTSSGGPTSITARSLKPKGAKRKGGKPRRTRTPFQKAWKQAWKHMKEFAAAHRSFDRAVDYLTRVDIPERLEARVLKKLEAYRPQYMRLVKRSFVKLAWGEMKYPLRTYESFHEARERVMKDLSRHGTLPSSMRGDVERGLNKYRAKYKTLVAVKESNDRARERGGIPKPPSRANWSQ